MKNKTALRVLAAILAALLMMTFMAPVITSAEEAGEYGNAWVYDESQVVSQETEEYIANLNETVFPSYKGKPQLAFIIIDRLPCDMDEYKLDMFNEYGVGTKEENHGMLFVFAIDDREYGLEIGDGFVKGSVLRKDLETDFITEDMKNSLRAEDYDAVVRQVAEYLAGLMADEEYGVYVQKEEAAAIKRAEQEAAAAEAKEAVKNVAIWTLIITVIAGAGFGLFKLVVWFYANHKTKVALDNMFDKYHRCMSLFSDDADDISQKIRESFKGQTAEYVNDYFLCRLRDQFLNRQYQQLLGMGEIERYDKYKAYAARHNDLNSFAAGNIVGLEMIISEVDKDEAHRMEIESANIQKINKFLEDNDYRIENRAIVNKLHEKFNGYKYNWTLRNHERKLVTDADIEKYFVEILRELNFEYEFDMFCEEHKDEIKSKDFNKEQFYKEIKGTDNYSQYNHYRPNYNRNWMLHFMMLHMATQKQSRIEREKREEEHRRRRAAARRRQQMSSRNSSFGTGFGGGFSSGGGFKGGW